MTIRLSLPIVLLSSILIVGCQDDAPVAGAKGDTKTISAADAAKAPKSNIESYDMRSEQGEATVSTAGPTESQLGVPFYPGSTAIEKEGLTVGSSNGRTYHSKRKTAADPAKVVKWYKENVKSIIPTDDTELLAFSLSDTKSGTIRIGKEDGVGTVITIVVMEVKA